jgi:hypothetical protein
VREGRRLSRAAALERLVERYVRAAVYTRPRLLARLLGVPLAEMDAVVVRLVKAGRLRDTPVDGWAGRWLVSADAGA